MRLMFMSITLLILYSFKQSQSDPLKVIGPEAPLVAVAGEDLILPCFIKPNTSAVDMTVEWLRLEGVASLVHLYEDHEDRNEKQVQSYRGRTSMFKEELQKGNASLKLSALQVSDEGKYKCLIEDKSWYDDITINVTVEVLGSHPVITVESYDNLGGINLMCESRGWNPEPEVLWLDSQAATLPAEDTQIHRDTDGFSVKRRITVYDYSDSNTFYCRFQQKHHMNEAKIIINSKIFDAWKKLVGFLVSACLIVVGLIIFAIIRYKKASELQKQQEKEASALQKQQEKEEFIKKKKFAVDVTLDPHTAHPYLKLSDDGKQVACGNTKQDLPNTPERFKFYLSVLGKQSFSSGRFYYEVQVSGKPEWILGVVSGDINRKGRVPPQPQNGFWTVMMKNANQYRALDHHHVPLTVREKLEKVGLFVDHEEGLVSFYNVKSSSRIYSFTNQSFSGKMLYPFFHPYLHVRDDNFIPLIISPLG